MSANQVAETGWLCAGCGKAADENFLTGCDCPTSVLFRRGVEGHRLKAETCHKHSDRPMRICLDGDNLCQECASAWVRAEGRAIAKHEEQPS